MKLATCPRGWVSAAVALWFGVLAPATHADATAADGQQRLDEFFEHLTTFEANFVQILTDRTGQVIDRASGHLAIAKPWRFRWDYTEPATQVIVADGERLWLYDRDLEQVTVRSIDTSLAGTPAMLLSGEGTLAAEFRVERVEDRGKLTWLALAPLRPDTDFREVRLGLDGDVLRYMELDDKLGQTTVLEFTDAVVNPQVDPSRFVFTPPPGADVIGETGTPAAD